MTAGMLTAILGGAGIGACLGLALLLGLSWADWRAARRDDLPPACLHFTKPCGCERLSRSEHWLANLLGGPVGRRRGTTTA